MTRLTEIFGLIPKAYNGRSPVWNDLFGVELEIEEHSDVPAIAGWDAKADGSLRNGVEYILNGPKGGDELRRAIDAFYNAKLRYTNGPRTSTHIHVNATDMTVDNLRSMIVIMYTIEDALFTAIGESRKWAGYAMPLRDMEPPRMREIMVSADTRVLSQAISPRRNQDRYYGFNICVHKHGTVEFRYFPGGPTKEELTSWIDLVCAVKKAAVANAVEGLANYGHSTGDLLRFLRSILPTEWYDKLVAMTTPETLLENFSEITALCFGEEQLKRRETIVFATKPLLKFMRTTLFGQDAVDYIEGVSRTLPVMAYSDWLEHLSKAWMIELKQADNPASYKPKRYGQVGLPPADETADYRAFAEQVRGAAMPNPYRAIRTEQQQTYEEVIARVQRQQVAAAEAYRTVRERGINVPRTDAASLVAAPGWVVQDENSWATAPVTRNR